ncbi:putative Rz-like lysis protein [Ralstonia phage phiRSP]|uniref:Putative Rz-like lysis protein n=1 Tax=Ralstonia phage phiRSP TaxID=2201420 RepID=A0A345ANS6_9CAUD|nr:Rz-like spanin [Ralstonia phage phiRSP]AXF38215.1 putative Rz-like lysis protein [Ralstonia phage phiRSP]
MTRNAIAIIGALVLFAALFLGGVKLGTHVEHNARLAEVADINARHATELAKAHKERADAEQRARDIEAQRAADMATLDAYYQKELSDAKTVSDRTIAGLRAGTLRVRERFTCPGGATRTGAAGQAGAGAGVGDAATRYGLQAEDVAVLLLEADRADEVTIALRACQAIVRGDRGGAP